MLTVHEYMYLYCMLAHKEATCSTCTQEYLYSIQLYCLRNMNTCMYMYTHILCNMLVQEGATCTCSTVPQSKSVASRISGSISDQE